MSSFSCCWDLSPRLCICQVNPVADEPYPQSYSVTFGIIVSSLQIPVQPLGKPDSQHGDLGELARRGKTCRKNVCVRANTRVHEHICVCIFPVKEKYANGIL